MQPDACSCGATNPSDCLYARGGIPAPEQGCRGRLRFVPLEAFATTREDGADPLVLAATSKRRLRAVIPAGGFILVYGDAGAGKTSALVDVAFHLAAGLDWCGVLEPVRPLRIAWIENEGPRPMLREKLETKLAAWPGPNLDGRIQVLDEPWGRFTFKKELHAVGLAAAIDEHQTDLLIVGPLSRVGMEGPGSTEDILRFLGYVEAALDLCHNRPAILIVHHENRAGQVSGAWEREPDTLVQVQGQGHGRTRVFWQKVRWASDLHATATQLVWSDGEGFTVEEREEVTEDTIERDLLEAIRANPGASWRKVRATVKGNAELAAEVRDRLIAAGAIVNQATRDGYFNLHLPDDPAASGSELRTALEPLASPLPLPDAGGGGSVVPVVLKEPRNLEPHHTANGTGADHRQNGHVESTSLDPLDEHDERPPFDDDELERLAAIARDLEEHPA